jgi:hypothetical protein
MVDAQWFSASDGQIGQPEAPFQLLEDVSDTATIGERQTSAVRQVRD